MIIYKKCLWFDEKSKAFYATTTQRFCTCYKSIHNNNIHCLENMIIVLEVVAIQEHK